MYDRHKRDSVIEKEGATGSEWENIGDKDIW